jgi:hypothetical protein
MVRVQLIMAEMRQTMQCRRATLLLNNELEDMKKEATVA